MIRFLLLIALMMFSLGPSVDAWAQTTSATDHGERTHTLIAKKKKRKKKKRKKKKKKRKKKKRAKKKKKKKKKKRKAKAKANKKKKKKAKIEQSKQKEEESEASPRQNEEVEKATEAPAEENGSESNGGSPETLPAPTESLPSGAAAADVPAEPVSAPVNVTAKGPMGLFSKRGEMVMFGGLGVAVVGFGTGVFGLTQTLSGDETRRSLLGSAVWDDSERTSFQEATAQSALGRTLNSAGYGVGVFGVTVALLGIFL